MPEPFLERGRLSLHLLPVPCHQQNVITKSLALGVLHATVELNREIVWYSDILTNNLFAEGFGNSSYVNLKTKST